ncbi:copper resistance system multicopper oxidase [Methylotenera mobilis]|jgi:CopA family copper-resistance protein|uniref:copper resistance system multicopper oxidase n=1 Tax=Methylotenera mobilis TaxID=359408 RepID=UPI000381A008|nr:copper resistance system multicopper oxidase [Methylotenera mobilis]MDP3008189.1 copper resistance system multicopper oxidase [Methylococcales bacterium]PPC93270.1 MAG: copper resistance system multicopper oxidase [Methylotenera sp.]
MKNSSPNKTRGIKSSQQYQRRHFLKTTVAVGAGLVLHRLSPAYAIDTESTLISSASNNSTTATDLVIAKHKLNIAGRVAMPTVVNGLLPGPILRYREGETVTIRVTNQLQETSSIHWHGLIVPENMDGVPGVSFAGIRPGETFTYQFKLHQSGTYWYHSHSGNQEQAGLYGPLIIDPITPDPYSYDSECIVMLSDWTFEDPARVLAKMKKFGSYYNFNRRTMGDVFRDANLNGWRSMIKDRMEWAKMRMDPTDIADVTGFTYTYFLNGQSADQNWTTLFKPGERIRIRFINAGAMTHFDVRIPGLKMTLVQADGQNVEPVTVDEFRIAPAETYDMIVQPQTEEAYTIFAETMDRSGYAAGTLALRSGLSAPIPARRVRPLRTMADMGMSGDAMGNMAMPSKDGIPSADGMSEMEMPLDATPTMSGMESPASKGDAGMDGMAGMEMPSDDMPAMPVMENGLSTVPEKAETIPAKPHGPDRHGPGNSTVAEMPVSRINEPGSGLGDAGRRVLAYGDLRRLSADGPEGTPEREIELHITGNMERQIWGFDGKKYSEAKEPIPFEYGKWLRITFVNDTMMDHPMHLHGMWMVLNNGTGVKRPRKHTINVKPGERLSFDVKPDEIGKWAFHCHLLFHMELGMLRVVSVTDQKGKVQS